MHVYAGVFDSAMGPIYLRANDDHLLSLDFDPDEFPETTTSNCLIEKAKTQLGEYFSGQRREFDLPFEIKGTQFQKKVLEAMISIPYGEVLSYSEVAFQINHPAAFRAVGNACNGNKLPLLIPCHRVVAANGLGGFGCGLEKKSYLLRLEGYL